MTAWQVRAARPGETAAIEALQVRCVRAQAGGYYTEREIEAYIAEVGTLDRRLIADGTYYVVEDGRGLVGCGGWSSRPAHYEQADCAHAGLPQIRAFFVDPALRRAGIGRALLARVEREIMTAGHSSVVLTAMLSGVAFYHALSYRKTANTTVTLSSGLVLPSIDMLKELPVPDGAPAAAC